MMKRSNKLKVSSEIGELKRVIVHRPNTGIGRVTPERAEELLYDDIIFLPKMLEEHKIFTDILKMFLGRENVLDTTDLLYDIIKHSKKARNKIIKSVGNFEDLATSNVKFLKKLTDRELTRVLITGYYSKKRIKLFDPIPNFLFTRDIAVTVNDHVIITKASKHARSRESILTRFIFWYHPIFKKLRDQDRIIDLNDVDKFPPSSLGERVSVEGGDVMIFDKDHLLIGCSERTTQHGINMLKDVLFKKKIVKNIVQINVPKERYCMHIDTIFTRINHNHCAAFEPLVIQDVVAGVQQYKKDGTVKLFPSIRSFLQSIYPDMKFILCGNGVSPYAEREQWTDGCNLVAIRPGVALTYDRNAHTSKAFKKLGYKVIKAEDLLESFKKKLISPSRIKKTIITIPSSELSRARGGTHCMTCPLERD